MKKLPLLIFLLVFLFSGCNVICKPPLDKFSAVFSAEYKDVNIKGEIYSSSNNRMTLKISSPKTMKGYCYEYKDNALSIKYKNYIIKSEPDYLPDSDFSKTIFNTIKSLKKEDNISLTDGYNSNLEYKGFCASGNYILITNKDSGYIKEISFKENKLKVIFNKVNPIIT